MEKHTKGRTVSRSGVLYAPKAGIGLAQALSLAWLASSPSDGWRLMQNRVVQVDGTVVVDGAALLMPGRRYLVSVLATDRQTEFDVQVVVGIEPAAAPTHGLANTFVVGADQVHASTTGDAARAAEASKLMEAVHITNVDLEAARDRYDVAWLAMKRAENQRDTAALALINFASRGRPTDRDAAGP